MIFGLEFPPIENLVEWPGFFNKVALIYLILTMLFTRILTVIERRMAVEKR